MKSKFCLIRTDQPLDVGSFVYVIWVGCSDSESVKLTLVQEFCKDCGWYFKKWSPDVDSALELRSKITRVDGTKCVRPYRMISLSISECYQTIIDDSWSEIEKRATMTKQETYMRFRRDPRFLLTYHRKHCTTSCPPSDVNTFCHRQGEGFYNVIGGLSLAIIIFVLDALVSFIFNLN